MIFAYKIYSYKINGKKWEFLGNYASEQKVIGISDGSNVGPSLPLRLANIYSDPITETDIRYCVDYLGRIWYSRYRVNGEVQPLESPCMDACLFAIKNNGVSESDIELIIKASKEGSEEVSKVMNWVSKLYVPNNAKED